LALAKKGAQRGHNPNAARLFNCRTLSFLAYTAGKKAGVALQSSY